MEENKYKLKKDVLMNVDHWEVFNFHRSWLELVIKYLDHLHNNKVPLKQVLVPKKCKIGVHVLDGLCQVIPNEKVFYFNH